MTLTMYDSVTAGNIPRGGQAVLLYYDGIYRTWGQRWRFPRRHKLSMTVLGDPRAAGADCEPGNIDGAQTARFAAARLQKNPRSRPVCYGSRDLVVQGGREYGIPAILNALAARGIPRAQVRILSAHYGMGPHICGPKTCGASFQADGTQWLNTATYDESLLADDFFVLKKKRARIPKPKLSAVHKKTAGAGAAGGLAVAVLAVLHAFGIHLTPAESGAIDAFAATLGGYIAPPGYLTRNTRA